MFWLLSTCRRRHKWILCVWIATGISHNQSSVLAPPVSRSMGKFDGQLTFTTPFNQTLWKGTKRQTNRTFSQIIDKRKTVPVLVQVYSIYYYGIRLLFFLFDGGGNRSRHDGTNNSGRAKCFVLPRMSSALMQIAEPKKFHKVKLDLESNKRRFNRW